MVTKELLEFIKAQVAQGATRADLEGKLLAQGWQPQDLAEAFASVAPQPVAPIPQAPQPASAQASQPAYQMPVQVTTAASSVVAAPVQALGYAGFWRRLVAVFIDGLIIQAIVTVIALVIFFSAPDNMSKLMPYAQIIVALLGALYVILMHASSKQATLGKMVAGIKVTTLDGNKISFLRSLGRYFATYISALTFGIGHLMAGFTERKQALHDMIAGTVVVKYRESSVGKMIAIFLAVAILISGLSVFAASYLLKNAADSFFGGVGLSLDSVASVSDESAEDKATVVPLSRSEYESVLSKPVSGVESEYDGPHTYAGPAFVSYKPIASLYIYVALPVIPNVESVTKKNNLKISHIYAKDGKDIFDATSPFETDILFTELDFSKRDDPVPHLLAYRKPHLIDGAKDEDIAKIEGVVTLVLPLKEGGNMTVNYPFTLNVASGAASNVSAAIPTATKASAPAATTQTAPAKSTATNSEINAVIAGILKTREVFISADAAKIRAYLLKVVVDPADKQDIEAMSDDELLSEAGFMAAMYEELTEDVLRSPYVTITVTGDTASIKMTAPDGTKATFSAKKANGVWY